jgi:hypothetical protein
MTQQNLVTGLVISASLVVAFLLSQSDLVLPPIAKVILGALNVALTYWARVSNGGGTTTTTTLTQTVPPPVEPPKP